MPTPLVPFYDLVANCIQHLSVRRRDFGGVVTQQVFSAYGQTTQQLIVDPQYGIPYPFQYKGQHGYHTDTDTGLIYCQNRLWKAYTGC
ncbi:MAG: hypothetical protein H8F28_25340 [Fibrella sp.]|nr:hypothetical protein [Armatimonadota bacterium]